jgi:hypothetical protein
VGQEKRIEQPALSSIESSGQMLGDMAFGIEQRLCDHPLDRTDARHNDAPSPALIQHHARQPSPAGRRQRDRQEPFLQRRSQRPTERHEAECIAQCIELFVPGRAARRVVGQHLGSDLQLLCDERERRIRDQFTGSQETARIAQRAKLDRETQPVMRSPPADDDGQVVPAQCPVLDEQGFVVGKREQRRALLVRQDGATRHRLRPWPVRSSRSGQACREGSNAAP